MAIVTVSHSCSLSHFGPIADHHKVDDCWTPEGGRYGAMELPIRCSMDRKEVCSTALVIHTLGSMWRDGNPKHFHRLLGCTIGDGVSIEPGCVIDYDLVKIGNGTSISKTATINTSTVSLGVQSLNSVEIGAGCTIKYGCVIERGTIVRDKVDMEPMTLVTPFSTLEEHSVWIGKPAERIEPLDDIETGRDWSSEKPPSVVTSSSQHHRLTHLDATRTLTVFLLAPYLWFIEFSIAILIGAAIHQRLGFWGLGGLIWAPPTVVCAILFAVAITAKRLLLGKVKAGVWPQGGSFHARKYFVDHLVCGHALRWKLFSTNTGSLLAGSFYVGRQLLRGLGVKVEAYTTLFSDRCWTVYDLLSIGSRVVVGGSASFLPWHTSEECFAGETITISDDCFVGTNTAVLNGVDIAKGATVAGFSVVQGSVDVGQTAIGTRKYQTTIQEMESTGTGIGVPEAGKLCGLCGVWVGISVFVWLCFLVLDGTNVVVVETTIFEEALVAACTVAGGFVLVFPSYLLAMMWVGKALILGRVTPAVIASGSRRLLPRFAFGPTFLEPFLPYTIQTFGGTFVETQQWAALGANIGNRVYLDGILMFEPDLVSIGDWSSVTSSALTSHQVGRRTYTYSPIYIGCRCTLSNWCNLQLASMDDDTEMTGLTMPLTGSRLRSGLWAGYPARRIGDAPQPPRPRRSVWITLLCNPWSTFEGCLWLLTLPVQICYSCIRDQLQPAAESDIASNSSRPSVPDVYNSTFFSDVKSLKLRFDAAQWTPEIRILRIPAGAYIVSNEEEGVGNWWWRMASYEFDLSNDCEYIGRVSLGWWNIPLSILAAKLYVVDGRDLLWSHSWFTGDPNDALLFKNKSE